MYSKQVERQLHTPVYSGQREPDFSLFAEALAERDGRRAASLDAWLPYASVADLHRSLERGAVTCRELVLCCLRRIRQRVDLHAVGELNPDALAIADQLDVEIRSRNWRGPLHGILVLLKDHIATSNRMHTTAESL